MAKEMTKTVAEVKEKTERGAQGFGEWCSDIYRRIEGSQFRA